MREGNRRACFFVCAAGVFCWKSDVEFHHRSGSGAAALDGSVLFHLPKAAAPFSLRALSIGCHLNQHLVAFCTVASVQSVLLIPVFFGMLCCRWLNSLDVVSICLHSVNTALAQGTFEIVQSLRASMDRGPFLLLFSD